MARLPLVCEWRMTGMILLVASAGSYAAQSPVQSQGSAKAQAQLQAKQQQLAQHQAQVTHLQREVLKQQDASGQAADRMKQQDQAIEKMQQELQALHPAPAAGHR